MLPRHALSSIMVWNAGDGLWWAPTADNETNCAQLSARFISAGPFQAMTLSCFIPFTIHCSSQKSALQSMHPAQSLGF
jgi:hypothetical protein